MDYLPQHDSGGDGNVERVFCPELGDFDTIVGKVHDLLLHALYLVAEDKSVFLSRLNGEILQGNTVFYLFHGENSVSLGFQFLYSIYCLFEILPIHAFLGSESCFMNFPMGWSRRDTAKVYFGKPEGIGGAKHGTDIVQTTHVVQHDHEREFFRFFVFFRGEAIQFFIKEFARHNN